MYFNLPKIMELRNISNVAVLAALTILTAGYILAQNIIFGVITSLTALVVIQAWKGGYQEFAGALLLAGIIVGVGILEPRADFYGAIAVGVTIIAATGAALREGFRRAGPVAFAGLIISLAVIGRDPETMFASVIVAAAILYVSEQFGGAFDSTT